jgi:D-beta-D-heptose 7-phosphate kinase/D-beta-D-heptose 1-phosphate adenosyltransferase
VRRLKGESRPLQDAHSRADVLAAIEAVDLVVVFAEDTPLKLIERVRPQVLVKGGDYQRKEVVGHDLVEAAGGQTLLVDLLPGHSTSALVRRSAAEVPPSDETPAAAPVEGRAAKSGKPASLRRKSKL